MKRVLSVFSALYFAFLVSCNGNSTKPEIKNSGIEAVQQTAKAVSLNNKDWQAKTKEMPGTIVDVRTPDEWKTGYIEGAQFANIFDEDFIAKINEIQADKNKPIYIYCRSGNRSKQALTVLKENGYTQIYELNHGILGWEEEGNKTVK